MKIDKIFGLVIVLLFFTINSFAADNKPVINIEPGVKIDYEVILSSSMNAGLKKFRTDFKIWKQINFSPEIINEYEYTPYQSPSAVFGDFNNDGTIDVVLMGYGEYQKHILVLKSRKDKYVVKEIWMGSGLNKQPKSTRNIELALTLHPKGESIKKKHPNSCKDSILANDAFGVKNFDIDGMETLFPCEKYMVVSCIIRK
ncbi:MAG: hypothetical protein KAI33_05660 [Elusimicrobiales bacterium]|nr:hypothetical protein [Elusimicrobiales bacterium]